MTDGPEVIVDDVSFRSRLAGQAAWVVAGQVVSAFGTLVGLRLVTEAVPPSVYGTVVLAVGIVALAQGIAVRPMMQAVLRYYPEYLRVSAQQILRIIVTRMLRQPMLWLSVSLAVVLGVWANEIHEGFVLGPLCAGLFVIDVTRTVEVTFLNAAAKQRPMAQLVVADAWLRPMFAVLAVWVLGVSAAAVLGGYVVGAAIPVVALHAYGARTEEARSSALSPEHARLGRSQLWLYARPLMLIPLIGWVSGQADRFIVGSLIGLESAGLYAAIYALASRPYLMLGNAVELSLRQVYYTRVTEGDRFGQRRVLAAWIAVVFGGGTVLLVLIALLHRQVAALLLAPAYRAYSALMIWVGVGYTLAVCAQVVERVCYALHDTRGVFLIETGGAVFSVVVGVPMVMTYGVRGAAWAAPVYFGMQLLLAVGRATYSSRMAELASQFEGRSVTVV